MRNFLNSLLSGLVAGIIFAVIVIVGGILLKNVFFTGSYQQASELWKELGFSSYFTIIGMNIVIGLLTGVFYNVIKRGLPDNWFFAGLIYGFMIWIIGRVPVISSAFATMKIPSTILLGWLIIALILSILGCIGLTLTFSVFTKGGEARKALAEHERRREEDEKKKSEGNDEDREKYITA